MIERETIIEAREISFAYGGCPVLDKVSFSIARGEFAAVIGSNGTGKSTLLKLILGELAPAAGEIRLWGRNVASFKNWPRVGYVPQNGASMAAGFPATAAEIVASSLYSRIGFLRPAAKIHRQKALDALGQMGVRELAGRMIGDMSGGQLQRVMIARVLVGGCELMLLDEPTTGVDSASTDALYQKLAELNRQSGITILMVTHDVQRAAEYVGRALCLEEGSMVELDREELAHELSHRHKHPNTKHQ